MIVNCRPLIFDSTYSFIIPICTFVTFINIIQLVCNPARELVLFTWWLNKTRNINPVQICCGRISKTLHCKKVKRDYNLAQVFKKPKIFLWYDMIFKVRRGIAPIFLKNVLNLFVCIKLYFFLTIFLSLSDLFPWWI